MSATRKTVQAMADRLISTLDSLMPSETADAIVRDVATELYRDVLGVAGEIVMDTSQATGHIHTGGNGKKRQYLPIAKYRFERTKW